MVVVNEGAGRLPRRSLLLFFLGLVVGGGLAWIIIMATGVPPGPVRVRFFNGHNSNAPALKVEAYAAEGDAAPARTVQWASSVLPPWRYALDNLDDGDYTRLDLWVDGALLKSFRLTDVQTQTGDANASKLGELFILRIDRGGKDYSVGLTYVSGTGNTPNRSIVWDQP